MMTQHLPRIIVWGAGAIGRGFVGDIFSSSGYELIFVDQAKSLVDKLNGQGFFTVVKSLAENDISYEKIENFTALHTSQELDIQKSIIKADLIAVSTFPKDFEVVAKILQRLIINRISVKPNTPIDIILCTNLVHAGPMFQKYLYKDLDKAYQAYFSDNVGIVESLVIRIAPPAPQEEIDKDPLVVWTNGYFEFPVDKKAFKGPLPKVPNFRFVHDMRAEENRKIYTYNMSHAILGYYGYQLSYDLLVESLNDPFVQEDVLGALDEVSRALQIEYDFSKIEMDSWVKNVIRNTNNSTVGDSVLRMAADPIRKLKKEDRLIGPALLCLKNGIDPIYIIKGIAAALHYENDDDVSSRKMITQIKNKGLRGTIREICELGDDDLEKLLVEKIEVAYHKFPLELLWHQKTQQAYQLGFKYERIYHGCGQCVYAAVAEILDIFDPQVFNAATGLSGGIGLMNDATCSAFSGAVLALGQLFPRRYECFSGDRENKYKNFRLVQQLRKKFENEFGTIKCAEIHQKKYGRSFDLQSSKERTAFEEAGGHGERGCTDTVGKAAQYTIEVIAPYMIQREMEVDKKDLKLLKISEVIRPETIDLELTGINNKDQVIEHLAEKLNQAGLLIDKDVYLKSVYEREEMTSTYMGYDIAIPHGKSSGVREAGIAFGRSTKGFEYVSKNDKAIVRLVFLLAIPNRTSADDYMAVLAKLARLLIHDEFQEALKIAKNYEDVLNAIIDCEKLLID